MTIFILNSSNENVIVLDNTISLPSRRHGLGRRSGGGAGGDASFVPGPQSGLNYFSSGQRSFSLSGSRITGQIEDQPSPPHLSPSPDPSCGECNARHSRGLRDAQLLGPTGTAPRQGAKDQAQQRAQDPHSHQGRNGGSNSSSNGSNGNRATFQDR